MMKRRIILAAAMATLLTACVYDDMHPMGPGAAIKADSGVKITPDGQGGYSFSYSGPYADSEGNLDFSKGRISEGPVIVEFSITDAPQGVKFKSPGADAIWIADKEYVGQSGSPEQPYEGRQFSNFVTSQDGKTLTFFNLNNDRRVYRYGLRFDFNGATIMHDPDMKNGGHG